MKEEGRAGQRGGETGRVMYYRTEIDYWKRYQSYKHSLPLILQSCDVEPSHRRPSLLIPPPAIPPALFPPLFPSVSFSLSPLLILSSLPSYLSTFLSRKPLAVILFLALPTSLRNGVYGVSCLYRMSLSDPDSLTNLRFLLYGNFERETIPRRDSINFRHFECRDARVAY